MREIWKKKDRISERERKRERSRERERRRVRPTIHPLFSFHYVDERDFPPWLSGPPHLSPLFWPTVT